jgi:hypothetical protein
MQAGTHLTIPWPSPAYLRAHFHKHGARLGIRTEQDYDLSARATIRVGTRLLYTLKSEDRVGYFWQTSRRFTALSDDEQLLLSHFRATENYVRHLSNLIYPAP